MKRKSLIQSDTDACFLCGCRRTSYVPLEEHHIFGGSKSNRKKSTKYKLTVWLCVDCHRLGDNAVHREGKNDNKKLLHKLGQKAFEKTYGTREFFMYEFGKNYLD